MFATVAGPVISVTGTTTPPVSTSHTATTTTHLVPLLHQCSTLFHLKQIHAQFFRTGPDGYGSFVWNTLIRAYSYSPDHKQKSLFVFYQMLDQVHVGPDQYTFPFVLKACAYLFALFEGKQVHAQAVKRGFVSDMYINNSLIHFYSSCGCLKYARKVFEKMPNRSVVSWNAMINALVELGQYEDALRMFNEMQMLFEPDGYTVQSLIGACAGLGALSLGMWAHLYVLRKCKYDSNIEVLVNSSLVEMYFKCGALNFAVQVFEGMEIRNVNSWNSIILGFAMHGKVEAALEYFRRMVDEGVVPNSITFLASLSACSHGGYVDEGREYFTKMKNEYSIEPVLEHYGCLVDLLARASLIEEALDIVTNMPMKPDSVIWRCLLDACCKQNVGLGLTEEICRQMIDDKSSDSSGAYVLLSRVYASADCWNEVGLIRKLMAEKGINKEPGCSLVEVDGVAHEFFAGDTSHPQTKEIYQHLKLIEEKLRSMGYVPDSSQAAMIDESSDGKGLTLRLHSERLAIAFALMNLKPGLPIRIFKNLRICSDCHTVMKLISKIYEVEVIVRDRLRFHHFRDGLCSCRDYW